MKTHCQVRLRYRFERSCVVDCSDTCLRATVIMSSPWFSDTIKSPNTCLSAMRSCVVGQCSQGSSGPVLSRACDCRASVKGVRGYADSSEATVMPVCRKEYVKKWLDQIRDVTLLRPGQGVSLSVQTPQQWLSGLPVGCARGLCCSAAAGVSPSPSLPHLAPLSGKIRCVSVAVGGVRS